MTLHASGILATVLLGVLARPPLSHAIQDTNESIDWTQTVKSDIVHFPYQVAEGFQYTCCATENITALLIAGGASVAMHNGTADADIADHFQRHEVFTEQGEKTLDVIGSPYLHIGTTLLWYTAGAYTGDDLNRQHALTMLTALCVNSAATIGLKAICQNDRPNGKSWAWPSAHTSSSFTAASVLYEIYGPRIGIPCFGLAGLIGYRMMDSGDHWASDVVFGATLGWVVGHSIARHKIPEIAGFQVLPHTTQTSIPVTGLCLRKIF
jgi:hypothetical protein